MACLLYDQGAFHKASALIWEADRIPATDLDLAFAARTLAKDQPHKAIRLLTAVLENNRGNAAQNMGMANALLHHGMVLQSARFYGAALKDDPKLVNPDLEHFILWTDDQQSLWGDFKDRLPRLDELPWMTRDSREASRLTNRVSDHTTPIAVPKLHQLGDAASFFQSSALGGGAMSVSDASLQWQLDGSDTVLLEKLAANPSDWDARQDLAHLYYDHGEYSEAAAVIWESDSNPSIDLDLAFTARILAKDQPRKAIRLLTAALENNRGKALPNMDLANALLHHGMVLQAVRFYGAALEDDPSLVNPDLEHFILWTDDAQFLWGNFKEHQPPLGELPWPSIDPMANLGTNFSTAPIVVSELKRVQGEKLSNDLYQQLAEKNARITPPPAVTVPVDRVAPKHRGIDSTYGASIGQAVKSAAKTVEEAALGERAEVKIKATPAKTRAEEDARALAGAKQRTVAEERAAVAAEKARLEAEAKAVALTVEAAQSAKLLIERAREEAAIEVAAIRAQAQEEIEATLELARQNAEQELAAIRATAHAEAEAAAESSRKAAASEAAQIRAKAEEAAKAAAAAAERARLEAAAQSEAAAAAKAAAEKARQEAAADVAAMRAKAEEELKVTREQARQNAEQELAAIRAKAHAEAEAAAESARKAAASEAASIRAKAEEAAKAAAAAAEQARLEAAAQAKAAAAAKARVEEEARALAAAKQRTEEEERATAAAQAAAEKVRQESAAEVAALRAKAEEELKAALEQARQNTEQELAAIRAKARAEAEAVAESARKEAESEAAQIRAKAEEDAKAAAAAAEQARQKAAAHAEAAAAAKARTEEEVRALAVAKQRTEEEERATAATKRLAAEHAKAAAEQAAAAQAAAEKIRQEAAAEVATMRAKAEEEIMAARKQLRQNAEQELSAVRAKLRKEAESEAAQIRAQAEEYANAVATAAEQLHLEVAATAKGSAGPDVAVIASAKHLADEKAKALAEARIRREEEAKARAEEQARMRREEEAKARAEEEAKARIAALAAARVQRFKAAAQGLPLPAAEARTGEWYFIMNGEVMGPIHVEELRQKIDDPEINPPLKMIWTVGMDHWTPVYECADLWTSAPA